MSGDRPARGRRGHRRGRGYTLVELAVAAALAGVLVASAVPGWQEQRFRAGRSDAVAALTRVQTLQEGQRASHGLYASRLEALRGAAALSIDGRYAIALQPLGADGYLAVATARAGSPQAGDSRCAELTLRVVEGFATTGPSAACWGR